MWNLIWFFCVPWVPVSADVHVDNTWGWQVDRWEPLVTHIAEMYDAVDEVDTFMRVMHCESRGDPYAHNTYVYDNPKDQASGLMQHMPRWWEDRVSKAGMAGYSPFDPVANIHASFWLLTLPRIGGWVHWECY